MELWQQEGVKCRSDAAGKLLVVVLMCTQPDKVSRMPKLPTEQGCMSYARSLQAALWVRRSSADPASRARQILPAQVGTDTRQAGQEWARGAVRHGALEYPSEQPKPRDAAVSA